MIRKILHFLKREFIGRPFKLPEDDFQEFRGQILFAIGETQIRNSLLIRQEMPDELFELRVQSRWNDISKRLIRFSKRSELASACQQLDE